MVLLRFAPLQVIPNIGGDSLTCGGRTVELSAFMIK